MIQLLHTVNIINNLTNSRVNWIWNRTVTSQIVGNIFNGAGVGSNTTAHNTCSIDFTVEQTLTVTAQKSTGTDTITLEAFMLKLHKA